MLAAAFFAGALNAAAGGGTFLTLPALMFLGVPPVTANATGTVALLPGYVASCWGFREELRSQRGVGLGLITVSSLVGGAVGAALLLVTSNHAFRVIVPWLMLAATVLFACGPWLLAHLHRAEPAGHIATTTGVFLVSAYGGYFNGGLGIMLLALLGLLGYTDLNFMNGLKNLVSVVLTAIAVGIYAAGKTVVWEDALLMMPAAVVGGYAGARAVRRLPERHLRYGIVAVGAITAALFFFKW
jgi:uncharacterized membrane protein YfcA